VIEKSLKRDLENEYRKKTSKGTIRSSFESGKLIVNDQERFRVDQIGGKGRD